MNAAQELRVSLLYQRQADQLLLIRTVMTVVMEIINTSALIKDHLELQVTVRRYIGLPIYRPRFP